MRAAALSILLMLSVCAHAQITPQSAAAQAVETVNSIGSGTNPAYFQAGKDLANSPKGNTAVKGAITGANATDKVPGYATTHHHSSLFAGGDGDLTGPGASKVSGCVGFTSTDKAKQYECDAVNLVAGNPPRPKFDIRPDDPILTKGKAVKNELAAIKDAFGEKYSACQTKTVTDPDTYTTEVCADIIGNDPATCVYGRKIEIDVDSNFQCDKTVNAYETYTCKRSFQPDIDERCDASTPYTTTINNVTASWWWCGSSCEGRADTFINTLVSFATGSVGLTLEGIYRVGWDCPEGTSPSEVGDCVYAPVWGSNGESCPLGGYYDSDRWACVTSRIQATRRVSYPSQCYDVEEAYFAVFTGTGPDIQLYMDGTYRARSKIIGYKCDVSICYNNYNTCFYKSSRKPMIEFRASLTVTSECTNKVWTCHHKGRFPCHWACKDTGVLCAVGTLTQNPDGSYSCLSNCRNELVGVTYINECAALEARAQ